MYEWSFVEISYGQLDENKIVHTWVCVCVCVCVFKC